MKKEEAFIRHEIVKERTTYKFAETDAQELYMSLSVDRPPLSIDPMLQSIDPPPSKTEIAENI